MCSCLNPGSQRKKNKLSFWGGPSELFIFHLLHVLPSLAWKESMLFHVFFEVLLLRHFQVDFNGWLMEHELQISTIYPQWYWGSIGLSQIESKCTMIKITTWTKSCRLKPCFGALAGLINTSGWRQISRIKLPAMAAMSSFFSSLFSSSNFSYKDLSSLRGHIKSSHLKRLRLQEMRASADVLPAVGP